MNNDIRSEMIVVLNSEDVCDDCQIRILSYVNKFINNVAYLNESTNALNVFFVEPSAEFNIWIELPKMISVLIDLHKSVVFTTDIEKDYMKFVLYGIMYNYLDSCQAHILNRLEPGHFRICFLNLLEVLLTKPNSIKAVKQTLFEGFWSCVCGDEPNVIV